MSPIVCGRYVDLWFAVPSGPVASLAAYQSGRNYKDRLVFVSISQGSLCPYIDVQSGILICVYHVCGTYHVYAELIMSLFLSGVYDELCVILVSCLVFGLVLARCSTPA